VGNRCFPIVYKWGIACGSCGQVWALLSTNICSHSDGIGYNANVVYESSLPTSVRARQPGPMVANIPSICTNVPPHWDLPCLPPEGAGPTPTPSESSWIVTPSDCDIAGESIVFKRSSTIDNYVAPPTPPYPDDYDKLSITNGDAWDWSPDQVRATSHNDLLYSHSFKIKRYIEIACLRPRQTQPEVARQELKSVWSKMVCPAL
jgi:hypothetical protein